VAVVDPLDAHMWYGAADVFVSPVDNVNETFGITPIEAMACGTPQIVSDWNGYRDTVVHGETGFLVPTRWAGVEGAIEHEAELVGDSWEIAFKLAQVTALDLDMFQQSIQVLLENEPLARRMAEASRRRALERYSWTAVIREHLELWQHLAEIAACDDAPADACTYLRPRFDRCFAHYAVKRIDPMTEVSLTREGQMIESGESGPPIGLFLQRYINPMILQTIATGLRIRMTTNAGKTTFGLLCDDGAAALAEEKTVVRRHVMWMAKHGLVRLGDENRVGIQTPPSKTR
jgi:D-inositol-3-phosphate glycosyltransferase